MWPQHKVYAHFVDILPIYTSSETKNIDLNQDYKSNWSLIMDKMINVKYVGGIIPVISTYAYFKFMNIITYIILSCKKQKDTV